MFVLPQVPKLFSISGLQWEHTLGRRMRHLSSEQVTGLHTQEFLKGPALHTKFYLIVQGGTALSTPVLPQQDPGLLPSPVPCPIAPHVWWQQAPPSSPSHRAHSTKESSFMLSKTKRECIFIHNFYSYLLQRIPGLYLYKLQPLKDQAGESGDKEQTTGRPLSLQIAGWMIGKPPLLWKIMLQQHNSNGSQKYVYSWFVDQVLVIL